jgi:hypothetical protein
MKSVLDYQLEIAYDIVSDPLHKLNNESDFNEIKSLMNDNINKISILERVNLVLHVNSRLVVNDVNSTVIINMLNEHIDSYKELIFNEDELSNIVEYSNNLNVVSKILKFIK